MELPAGRAATGQNGVNAIDFRQLYRAEKRKAAAARRGKNNREDPTATTHSQQTIADEDAAVATAGAKPTSTSSTNSKQHNVSAPSASTMTFPPWKYPELLKSSHNHSIPRLDRTRDCLSKTGIYYQPHFLAEHLDYQAALMEWLSQLPVNHHHQQQRRRTTSSCPEKQEQAAAMGKWTILPHARRRVALFDASSSSSSFPPPLQWLVQRLVHEAHVFSPHQPPNHILINHYTGGEQGILPHTDGPAYHDRTATISLGHGSVLLNFVPNVVGSNDNDDDNKNNNNNMQVLLHGGGSLIVFERQAYSQYKHGIAELNHCDNNNNNNDDDAMRMVEHAADHCLNAPAGTAVQREERISITVRRRRKR